jgi:hypothetical protein
MGGSEREIGKGRGREWMLMVDIKEWLYGRK